MRTVPSVLHPAHQVANTVMLGVSLSSGWGCTLLTILAPRHALHGEHGAVEASIKTKSFGWKTNGVGKVLGRPIGLQSQVSPMLCYGIYQ